MCQDKKNGVKNYYVYTSPIAQIPVHAEDAEKNTTQRTPEKYKHIESYHHLRLLKTETPGEPLNCKPKTSNCIPPASQKFPLKKAFMHSQKKKTLYETAQNK